jgi:hypothetical protein
MAWRQTCEDVKISHLNKQSLITEKPTIMSGLAVGLTQPPIQWVLVALSLGVKSLR